MNIKKKIIVMPIMSDPDTTCYHFEVEPQMVHNYCLMQFEYTEYTLKLNILAIGFLN